MKEAASSQASTPVTGVVDISPEHRSSLEAEMLGIIARVTTNGKVSVDDLSNYTHGMITLGNERQNGSNAQSSVITIRVGIDKDEGRRWEYTRIEGPNISAAEEKYVIQKFSNLGIMAPNIRYSTQGGVIGFKEEKRAVSFRENSASPIGTDSEHRSLIEFIRESYSDYVLNRRLKNPTS